MSTTPKKSIRISFEGNTTRATMLTDYHGDTYTKTAFAKYNPVDAKQGFPYSEFEGARIALARLFGLEPFTKDDEPQFKEGDIVRLNVSDERRSMVKNALCKVELRAPNKMTPYVVKILDEPNTADRLFKKYGIYANTAVVFAGEMHKIEEAQ